VPGAFLSGAAVASQWCIYSQIKEFGALVFAATMNVRQALRGMEAPEKLGILSETDIRSKNSSKGQHRRSWEGDVF